MSTELWSVIATCTFWCWVASSLLFMFRAFPRLGVFQARPAMIWGATSILCAGLWIIALRLA